MLLPVIQVVIPNVALVDCQLDLRVKLRQILLSQHVRLIAVVVVVIQQ